MTITTEQAAELAEKHGLLSIEPVVNKLTAMLTEHEQQIMERIAQASPDELMRFNSRMALCARLLIDGCLNAGTGHQAVAKWDAARSMK